MSVKIDTTEYDKNAQELLAQLGEFATDALRRAASAFAHSAAKYTPPDISQDKIKKERYYRPIFNLKELIDSGKAIQLDIWQYKKGKRWKVIDDKQHKVLAYTSSQSEAKKIAKIETRGLLKVMWGKEMPDIGGNVPAALQRLIGKSPQLRPLPYNRVTLESENGETSVEIENKGTGIERAAPMAESHGYASAMNTLSHIQKFFEKDRTL